MQISWGTRIAILYGGFVAMIATLVIATFFHTSDLVTDDYYQQETVYQQRIDASHNAVKLKQPLQIRTDDAAVFIQLPAAFKGKNITASIHFYAPASAAADRTFTQTCSDAMIRIPKSSLAGTAYEVQVSWQDTGSSYYQAVLLNLRQS